jgi:hypothetical protein
MASPKMWRYFEIFFETFALPHYFVEYNKTSRSARRGGRREWPFWAFYIAHGYGHGLLLIYYQLKYAVLSEPEISVSQRSLLVIFALFFTSIMVLATASIYTILLNEAKFAKTLSGICRFQSNFEGDIQIS